MSAITGAREEAFSGVRGLNPFIKGGATVTPYIPDLTDGAERFGLLETIDADAADFAALRDAAPTNAVAAVTRLDLGPSGYADDYIGFDMLLFINLTESPLVDPVLGIDSSEADALFAEPLLKGGLGDADPATLEELVARAVYATLIPDTGAFFNVGAKGAVFLGGAQLSKGQFAFVTAVPEPNCDADQDGDVDLADTLRFQACFTGPGGAPVGDDCRWADLDHDGDVDLADLLNCQVAFTGSR